MSSFFTNFECLTHRIRKSIQWITRAENAIFSTRTRIPEKGDPAGSSGADGPVGVSSVGDGMFEPARGDCADSADERAYALAEALATIEAHASGTVAHWPVPVDVAAIRKRTGMTQERFAKRFGFPVATRRHWERGDRSPKGPALVLLNVIARNPKAVFNALSQSDAISDDFTNLP